jgi:flotillin
MNILILSGFGAAVMFVAIAVLVALLLRRVVPTNEVHIVQTAKQTTSFGKDESSGNTYYAWPAWMPVIGLSVTVLPVSVFAIRLDEYEAYDRDRVPFLVDVVSFFRISDSNTAAQRVSAFAELEGQLEAIVQGAVRTVLAKDDIDHIMVERSKFGQQFTEEVHEQLKRWGVEPVKSIELMDIRDAKGSTVIHNIMAKRTSEIEKDSRTAVAANKRQAEIAEIEAQREVDLQQQAAQEQVGKRTAEREQNVGIANEQAQQQIKVEQRNTAEREQEVRRVTEVRGAEIVKDVEIVRAEQARQTSIIQASATKESSVIAAEGVKQETVLTAEGNLEAKRREAEGIRAEGEARGDAEKAVLLAPVHAQITLAEKIGSDEGYQGYLIEVRKIEANEKIGVAQAASLEKASIKVIANTGDSIGAGISTISELFTPKGGQTLGGMLEAAAQTPVGKAVLERVAGKSLDSTA